MVIDIENMLLPPSSTPPPRDSLPGRGRGQWDLGYVGDININQGQKGGQEKKIQVKRGEPCIQLH